MAFAAHELDRAGTVLDRPFGIQSQWTKLAVANIAANCLTDRRDKDSPRRGTPGALQGPPGACESILNLRVSRIGSVPAGFLGMP